MKSSSSDATSVDKASYRLRKTWSGAQCEFLEDNDGEVEEDKSVWSVYRGWSDSDIVFDANLCGTNGG